MSNKNKNAVKAILRTAAQLLAVMAIILVTFTSCGKNDDGDNKKLIGTWVWESATLDGRNVEDIYRNLGLNIGTCYKKTKLVFTDKEVALYTIAKLINVKKNLLQGLMFFQEIHW